MKFLLTTNYKYEHLADPGKNRHNLSSTVVELSELPDEKYLRKMCKYLAEEAQKTIDAMVPHHTIAVGVDVVAVSQLGEDKDEEPRKEQVNGQG